MVLLDPQTGPPPSFTNQTERDARYIGGPYGFTDGEFSLQHSGDVLQANSGNTLNFDFGKYRADAPADGGVDLSLGNSPGTNTYGVRYGNMRGVCRWDITGGFEFGG